MNKVIKISISGFSYTIDIDAHTLLNNYISSLKNKYGDNSENELVQDIESRIAEILNEKLPNKDCVVNIEMIRNIISQIGTVSSIERDSLDTQSGVRFNFENEIPKKPIGDEIYNKIKYGGNSILRAIVYILIAILVVKMTLFIGVLTGLTVIISPFWAEMTGSSFIFPALLFASFIIGALFLIALIYRIIDNGRHILSKWATIISLFIVATIMGVTSTTSLVGLSFKNREYAKIQTTEHISDIDDSLKIEFRTNDYKHNFDYFIFDEDYTDWNNIIYYSSDNDFEQILSLKNNKYYYQKVDVDVHYKNDIEDIIVKVKKKSHGGTLNEASKRAKDINFNYEINGNIIKLDKFVKIDIKDALFTPNVDVDIYVPKNKVNVIKKYIKD